MVESQLVTDEDLNRAAEEKVEEEVVEEEVVEEEEKVEEDKVVEEPTDGANRSKLGRKFKLLEDQVQTLVSELKNKNEQIEEPNLDPDEYMTRKDVDKYLESQRREDAANNRKYNSDYISSVLSLSSTEEDEGFLDRVLTEMDTNVKGRHTGNPEVDAKINYLEASQKVLRGNKKPNPLEKNTKKTPGLGVDAVTKVTQTEKPLPELDEYAQDFLKKNPMSDEKIKEALSTTSVESGGKFNLGSHTLKR